ncbi:PREDICTED: sushi, von Willebrand factor type A, EGF and pentraxin domain-containing protein 1-like [Branchiostoma belcheri]|uniref:Sushi, von Willebrand factor type A, EGF and pentraxin domain-containing protein 1-like n=1 Tax=Branchiostoma belcheri TaxID=7741 RepID=A0A6P4YQE5_BRABE|nr:PREDICTED: sushi, von Willebrand factor type A, EGF and pentraxin domain-containing protein 1-like [Branchiostoma belcheri]
MTSPVPNPQPGGPDVYCAAQTIPNGEVSGYGDVVFFRCHPGYKLVGESTLTCQDNGTWSGSLPTCAACAVNGGTCSAWGDPHYTTFDGRKYDFQGPCRYTFAKDCGHGDFTVETKNEPLTGNPSVSVTREVYVMAFGIEIEILQGRVVKMNGETTSLPYHKPGGKIDIYLTGTDVRVRLVDSCVEVSFDGSHIVRVDVPRSYMNNTCGLCGNFNDDPSDDLNGESGTVFGNTHQTNTMNCSGGPTGPPPPCPPELESQVMADDKCGVIKDVNGPFAACQGVVDPVGYFEDCVFDMCAWDGTDGLCQNLKAYADACVAAGVQSESISWRTAERCPLACPANSAYSSCTSACPATCVNPSAPDNCNLPCVEGCGCNVGYVQIGLDCVRQADCGCTDQDGYYHTLGAVWEGDGEECECQAGNTIFCKAVQCQTLTAPTNGALSTTATSYQTVVTFSCNSGYQLNGATDATCQADGTWSNSDPTCEPVQCPARTAPTYGAVSPTGAVSYPNGVTFTCNSGYELDGAAAATCQADGTWSIPVPTCTPVPCPTLTAPTNGALSPLGPYAYPDGVTFTCNSGYQLNGFAAAACLADGTWSNPVPTCTPVPCPTLTAPTNGALSPLGPYAYPDGVTFTCNSGYQLNGATDATCQADGTWSNSVPTCEPVQCPARTAPTYGAVSPTGAVSYPNGVTFTCNSGYVLNGAAAATCQADGTWSIPVPTCELLPERSLTRMGSPSPVTRDTNWTELLLRRAKLTEHGVSLCQHAHCPTLTAPTNGALSPLGPYAYPDGVTFTCNSGYQLNGFAATACLADGTWSNPVPTCTPVQCPARTAPTNGAVSPTGAVSYPNGVTFACNSGYVLNGAAAATCQADGTWSIPVPTCTRNCVISSVQCPTLTAPTNGALSPLGPYAYPDGVTFTCNSGYQLNGATDATCEADGTWSNSVPTCEPVQCPARTAPTNGAVSPTGAVSYPNGVTFTCNSGYVLNGAAAATCQADGTWSIPVPTCTPVQCPTLTAPTNGALSPLGPYVYPDGVTFTCDTGYQLHGFAAAVCQADGTWSSPVPTCTRCPIADYVRFNGVCYKDYAELMTYDEARQTCAADGGLLAMPRDNATNTFIHDLGGAGIRWIGLTDTASEGQFVYEDGQSLESSGYSNWYPREPNDAHDGEDCVLIFDSAHGWIDAGCSLARGFICQLGCSDLYPGLRPARTFGRYQNQCFWSSTRGNQRLNYRAALQVCKSHGGTLAMIKNAGVQTFLTEHLNRVSGRRAQRNYWIGLDDLDMERSFVWNDGTPLGSYRKFRSRAPHKSRDCMVLWRTNKLTRWILQNCRDRLPYICQMDYNVGK